MVIPYLWYICRVDMRGAEPLYSSNCSNVELIWRSKYDEQGQLRRIELPEKPLPLQNIECIDLRQELSHTEYNLLSPFDNDTNQYASDYTWNNYLIWGDNKLVMQSLLQDFEGKVDLIYIDPPFNVGTYFSIPIFVGNKTLNEETNNIALEDLAFRDSWNDLDSYLNFMWERLRLMHKLLSDTGTIFIHCDWRVNYYLRCLMNEIFGHQNFLNEIIWHYPGQSSAKRFFPRKHDTILWYRRGEQWKFYPDRIRVPYKKSSLSRNQYGGGEGVGYRKQGLQPGWLHHQGKIIDTVWEIVDLKLKTYPTEKHPSIIERIILAASDENDLVADFFCGSGTTLAVAEQLRRRWIGVDVGRYAIHNTRKRIIHLQKELREQGNDCTPFKVYSINRYERQWLWNARFKNERKEYLNLILRHYQADASEMPSSVFQGKKGSAYIHVQDVYSVLDRDYMYQLIQKAKSESVVELHVLAWEIEPNLIDYAVKIGEQNNMHVELRYIPREALDSKCTKVHFGAPGLLTAEAYCKKTLDNKKMIHARLLDFKPSFVNILNLEHSKFNFWDFIDLWAVDFNYEPNKPFKYQWCGYRLRKAQKKLITFPTDTSFNSTGFPYEEVKHSIAVKVIDIMGVDTTIVMNIEDINF